MGPREPKEGSSKPIGIIRNGKQAKMGRRIPKKGISKWGLCKGQQTSKVKDMVVGPGKPERIHKNPWECKNGMGQGCPKEWSRLRMPKGKEWAEQAQDGMRINPAEILGNVNWIKEKYMASPNEARQAQMRPSKHKSSNNMTKAMQWRGRNTSQPTNYQ